MRTIAPLSASFTFTEAFDAWISDRVIHDAGSVAWAKYISERTEWDYRQYARALEKFFFGMRLADIDLPNLRAYERDRATCNGAWKKPAGANRIHKEVAMLVRILSAAGCWSEDRAARFKYERMPTTESDVIRAMSEAEQLRFLTVAGSRDEWQMIYQYTIAALQTTMSTNEMRSLCLGDVDLRQQYVQVRKAGAKNRFRIRTIPLETQEVLWAFEGLMWRARRMGAVGPQHFLFPYGARGGYSYDATQPMSDSGLRKPWDAVRREAGLAWLRPYDLRHTAITRMAEQGVPIAVIMAFAGHMSQKMQQHYTTVGMMAKRKAVSSTWSGAVPLPAGVSVMGVRRSG